MIKRFLAIACCWLLGCPKDEETKKPEVCEPPVVAPSPEAAGMGVSRYRLEPSTPVTSVVTVLDLKGTPLGTITVTVPSFEIPTHTGLVSSIDMGGVRVERALDEWFGSPDATLPSSARMKWTFGSAPLWVTYRWTESADTPAEARWSVPTSSDTEPPTLGFLRTGDGPEWALESTDPTEIDAWLTAVGLRDAYDGKPKKTLDAALADPAFWAVVHKEEACQTAQGLDPPPAGDPTIVKKEREACANAVNRCADVREYCAETRHLRRSRCVHREATCQAWRTPCQHYADESGFENRCTDFCKETCNAGRVGPYLNTAGRAAGFRCVCGESLGPDCTPARAATKGDPHYVTFDGLFYDFQGVGEFVVAESTDGYLAVQTRTAALNVCGGVSFNRAAVVRMGELTVHLSSDLTKFASVASQTLGVGGKANAGDARVERRAKSVVIQNGAGDEVVVTHEGDFLDLDLRVAPFRRGAMRGLLGNNDGDPSNDLTSADGQAPPNPTSRWWVDHVFGASYRVTSESSLFAYGPNESAETFASEGFPGQRLTTDGIPAERLAAATSTCAALAEPFRTACITDTACMGSSQAADSFTSVQAAEAAAIDESAIHGPAEELIMEDGVEFRIQNGPAGDPTVVGCADGQREGLTDQSRYPAIAGCLATWSGSVSMRAQRSGQPCGDDRGRCEAPADACASGWHVCGASGRVAELTTLSREECETAGGARYLSAMSHCASQDMCTYETGPDAALPCYESGWCSEAVCCGAACTATGACPDGVWPGATHITQGIDVGCGQMQSNRAGGVLCCRDQP